MKEIDTWIRWIDLGGECLINRVGQSNNSIGMLRLIEIIEKFRNYRGTQAR